MKLRPYSSEVHAGETDRIKRTRGKQEGQLPLPKLTLPKLTLPKLTLPKLTLPPAAVAGPSDSTGFQPDNSRCTCLKSACELPPV